MSFTLAELIKTADNNELKKWTKKSQDKFPQRFGEAGVDYRDNYTMREWLNNLEPQELQEIVKTC